jgi:predicted regulator of Ras-like GTPase activity (Roadblock/LC7/MglB family)
MFKDLLKKIATNIPGVRGCVLLDASAIPLAELYLDDDPESVQALAVELSTLIWSLRRRQALTYDIGMIEEMFLRTNWTVALCRVIAQEYILLITVDLSEDVDHFQSMMRLLSPWVDEQL